MSQSSWTAMAGGLSSAGCLERRGIAPAQMLSIAL
jgi:hypothetical protein